MEIGPLRQEVRQHPGDRSLCVQKAPTASSQLPEVSWVYQH